MTTLNCLIVAQPYASLIAQGYKRWEFRNYSSKVTGKIGIAASNGKPWSTRNFRLNRIAPFLPRGAVLATAELTTSLYVTSADLQKKTTEPVEIDLKGHKIKTYGEPIGEPLEDVNNAIAARNWRSYAWVLKDVELLEKPIPFIRSGRSTWVTVEIP
jgi:hypothetical protein